MSWAKYSGFHFATAVGLAPAAVTTNGNGTGIDRLHYSHLLAVANTTYTSGTGTLDIKIQDSADNSTGWADLTPTYLFDSNASGITTAAFSQISTDGVIKLDVDLGAAKRYIRFVKIASDTGSPSFVVGVVALLGNKEASDQPGATA